MSLGHFVIPPPKNEPNLGYEPGSARRASLKEELKRQDGLQVDVAPIIGGKRVETGDVKSITKPHDHAHVLGRFHQGGADQVQAAIKAAHEAKPAWAAMPWEERSAIFLRAAALLAGPHRDRLNAATMHGQSKTAHQAEIDSACELIDFLNFNVHYLSQIMAEQPGSGPGIWNRVESRPLDGFVFAITPFNFTAIAGNLPTAPAMCGNTVVWKPASTAVLSAHYLMELFEEAGLPPGVINLVPGSGSKVGTPAIESSELGGVHFTGSTGVFQGIWNQIGSNIERYAQYPRIVGETGGKDFVVVHKSADVDAVVTGLLRGAFEFQGQKCSAASRAYVPKGLWSEIKQKLGAELPRMTMGSVSDFRNFMGALIDKGAYAKVSGAIEQAKKDVGKGVVEILGGECDDSKGYFIRPTVIVVDDPKYITMQEELFGPALTIYVYDDNKFSETLQLCDQTSPYALTGAIFANDRSAVVKAVNALRFAAGNFYVNDKPTGAVVGQQPFGGSRASGTNDKAGSLWNLARWISPRTIKENLNPPKDWRYPFLTEQ